MTTSHSSSQLDNLFTAFASRHRREIIHSLGLQPRSITQLASERGLSLPAIHKHITVLEEAHLIQRKKVGQTNILSLRRESLRGLQEWLTQFHAYWGHDSETLENYQEYVEKNP